jgi:hypothetical protein
VLGSVNPLIVVKKTTEWISMKIDIGDIWRIFLHIPVFIEVLGNVFD